MIRVYRLYTVPDGNSRVMPSSVNGDKLRPPSAGTMIRFLSASLHWPAGLEFSTVGGETLTIHPGGALVAEDQAGSGHKWRLVNDEPRKRAYVILKNGADAQSLLSAR